MSFKIQCGLISNSLLQSPNAPKSLGQLWLQRCSPDNTYVDDEEIQPAPRVGEVHLEAVGHPLEQHLDDEDVGEDLVGVLQDGAYHLPLFNVDVLKSLEEAWSYVTVILPLDPLHVSVQPHPRLRFLGLGAA